MCTSCGCGGAHATHGDERNIVDADLKKVADASKNSLKGAAWNIERTFGTKNRARPWVDDAREP